MYAHLAEFFGVGYLSPSDFFFISSMIISAFFTILFGLLSRFIK